MEEITDAEKAYVIRPQIHVNDPWSVSTRTGTDIGENDPLFMCYLFDPDGVCLMNRGDKMLDSGNSVTFYEAKGIGEFTIYCITGWFLGEFPRITSQKINRKTLLDMHSPKDLCLGKAKVEVELGRMDYDVEITMNHIMAKAEFEICNVSPLVTSMSVTLPNQANQFTFEGEIIGNSQSQTLTLQKRETPNDNGTYNWFVNETIVYPYAEKTGDMPINVCATWNDIPYNFYTASPKRCNSGKRYRYQSDWSSVSKSVSSQIVMTPWTESVITGSFDLGKPIKPGGKQ